jgi:hypothetical protein
VVPLLHAPPRRTPRQPLLLPLQPREALKSHVETLRNHGARFRNDLVIGVGGKQILLEDPSGNPIELFEPILPEASLSPQER